METVRLDLPAAAPGTVRQLVVHRFGRSGARPKAYLQAALHADELPGALVLHSLVPRLQAAEQEGRIAGEVVVVPLANPIGLAQSVMQTHLGRYDLTWLSNFNRGWPDLTATVADAVGGRLDADPATNVALVRAALLAAVADLPGQTENLALRRHLLGLAVDADLVLDLHCDLEAALHLYVGTPLWPEAADLAADIGVEAVLLAETSGGNPFDEAFSSIWWQLARRFPDRPVPLACLASTIEYRGLRDVDAALAADDAARLLRFLTRRGVLAGEAGPLPAPRCAATPLTGAAMIEAPASGIVLFDVQPGDAVEALTRVARIVDPRAADGDAIPVVAPVSGRVFARSLRGFVRAGEVVVKVAGARPIAGRAGQLLPN